MPVPTSDRRRSIQDMIPHPDTNEESITKTKLFKFVISEFILLLSWSLSYYLFIPYMSDFNSKLVSAFIAIPVTIIFSYYAWFKKRTPKSNTKEGIKEWSG